VLFPALRLGYLVVPPALVDAFTSARALADRGSPVFEQAVLAEFLHEGHFARHIRWMRQMYGERQAVLIDAAVRALAMAFDA
jgi:GntR family transcriptional regulator/MocR family aminotransferase